MLDQMTMQLKTNTPTGRNTPLTRVPKLACPNCRTSIKGDGNAPMNCAYCHFEMKSENGIYRALTPEREAYFARFVSDYQTIRHAEGRGSRDSAYYLALPFRDYSGKLASQWRIRALSFMAFESKVLRPITREKSSSLDILDVGAGNCWLSYHLALNGLRPVAIDLLTDKFDGLGSAVHYFTQLGGAFPRFQAEMDRLPFADNQFDMVIFNSSLHYSTDYYHTLQEASRCLRPAGHLIVLDSPIYHAEDSGRRMREERHDQFFKDYGFRSDSVPSLEFLTFDLIQDVFDRVGIDYQTIRPWYGFQWAMRPLRASLIGKREPSKFHILWGRKRQS
jgi:SAM-dependent methyltransferase